MKRKSSVSVGVIMGSDSDYPAVSEALMILKSMGISHAVSIASAHRTPEKVRAFISRSERRGVRVFIAAAGGAAHLPGVIAAQTLKPVIGIPIQTSTLSGIDSLLSIVQMPGGIPVATMAIGKAGSRNAGLLAAAIIALNDPGIEKKLTQYRIAQKKEVYKRAQKIEKQGT